MFGEMSKRKPRGRIPEGGCPKKLPNPERKCLRDGCPNLHRNNAPYCSAKCCEEARASRRAKR